MLFNGRRLPTSPQAISSVDINLLPTAAIGRVEVLKDGAAATYGSDAIGGVVNFITRTDLQGFELNANYQGISGSPGDYEGSIAYGYRGDSARLLLTAGYRHRSEMSVKERDWALRTCGPEGYLDTVAVSAGTGNPGQYNTATSAAAATAGTFAGALPDIGRAANGGALRPDHHHRQPDLVQLPVHELRQPDRRRRSLPALRQAERRHHRQYRRQCRGSLRLARHSEPELGDHRSQPVPAPFAASGA